MILRATGGGRAGGRFLTGGEGYEQNYVLETTIWANYKGGIRAF